MSAVDFLDTNVLIYFLDATDSAKHARAEQIVSQSMRSQTAIISHQVVQETLSVLGRKHASRFDAASQQAVLRELLMPLMKVLPSAKMFEDAIRVKDRYGFSFYDALVVAAALQGGCKRLLSEDLQHGQVIDGLKIVNPFL